MLPTPPSMVAVGSAWAKRKRWWTHPSLQTRSSRCLPGVETRKVHSARLGSLTMLLLCSLPASIIDESLEISSVASVTWSFDRHCVARLPLEDGPVGQKQPRWKPFCFRISDRSVWQRSTIKEFTIKRFASMWLCKSGGKSELLITCLKNTSY